MTGSGNSGGQLTDPALMLTQAQAAAMPVFPLPFGAAPNNSSLLVFLNQLALDSSGRFAGMAPNLLLAAQQIGGLLANQYLETMRKSSRRHIRTGGNDR